MTRIQRIVLAALTFVLIGLATVPMVVGILVERNHPRAVRALSWALDGARLEQRSFERGWLDSRARVSVDAGGVMMTWQVVIRHGPWVGAPGWLSAEGTLAHPVHGDVGTLSARVSLDGRLLFDTHIFWADQVAARLSGEASDRMRDLRVDLRDARVSLAGLNIDDLSLGWRTDRVRRGEGIGDMQLRAGQIRWPGGVIVQPQVVSDWHAIDRVLTLNVTAAADSGALLNEVLSESRLSLTLERLDRLALYALEEDIRQGFGQGLRGGDLANRFSAAALLALPTLLVRAPKMVIRELDLNTASGALAGRAQLALLKAPPAGFMADPARLGEVIQADLDVRLDTALADRWSRRYLAAQMGRGASPADLDAATQDLMARLRTNQILVSEDGGYRLAAAFVEQQLTLNGQRMMLPSF